MPRPPSSSGNGRGRRDGGGETPSLVEASDADVPKVSIETRTTCVSQGLPLEELAALQDGLRQDLEERLAQQDLRIRELFSRYAQKNAGEGAEDRPPSRPSAQSTDDSDPPDPDQGQALKQGNHADEGVAEEPSHNPHHVLDHRHSFLKTFQGNVGHKYVTTENDIKVKTTAVERTLAAWTSTAEEPERSGRLARMVNSNTFGMLSSVVVLLTSITSILVTNYKMKHLEEESPTLRAISTVLSALFIAEVALKLVVHRRYFFMTEERGWNIFDFLLACSEVWGIIQLILDSGKTIGLSFLRSLRILKITRVLRMVRVISAFKELRLLLNALTSSITTVVWCGVVILFTLVMCSMVFVQISTDYLMSQPEDVCDMEGECLHAQLQKNFGSVQGAALSLFMSTTGGNDWSLYYHIFEGVGWIASSAFIVFTFCFQFGMFNLLTSMFVDRAMKASKPDLDTLIVQQRTTEHEQCKELREQLLRFDKDGGGTISLVEFEEMILDEAMSSFLASAGLDIHDAEMFFQMMTEISGEDLVSTDQFVQGCMRLKGLATSIDMQAMRYELKLISDRLSAIETS